VGTRKAIPKDVEARVLLDCRRRCALCYGLDGDHSHKRWQIAHIDHDRSNNAEKNLAYLCFDHHDQYDSKTSQSKNLTDRELVEYGLALVIFYTSAAKRMSAYLMMFVRFSTVGFRRRGLTWRKTRRRHGTKALPRKQRVIARRCCGDRAGDSFWLIRLFSLYSP
jgi:hypothetical protein